MKAKREKEIEEKNVLNEWKQITEGKIKRKHMEGKMNKMKNKYEIEWKITNMWGTLLSQRIICKFM